MIYRLLLASLAAMASAIPLQMTVNQRASECLYEKADEGESLTVSVFILAGTQLSGTVLVDGPVAPLDANSGQALQEAADRFDSGERPSGVINSYEKVDFEHLNIGAEEEEETELPPENETPEQRKERRARERKKALESRQRKEQKKREQKKKVRAEGEPWIHTFKAPLSGWYRFCLQATYYQISAELDFRREKEMGGLDEHGNVFTFEQKIMEEEDKLMEEDTAAQEGIKDEDFQSTRDKLKSLRRLLSEIQSKQQQERHRLIIHAATNEHSHSRMVLSSLLETILFMAVTGFQVYTIRKWFRGAPVLGR